MNLGYNGLITIEPNLLSDLTHLKSICFYANQITALNSSQLFANNKELEILNFSQNNLTFIHEDLFSGLNQLQQVDLSYNHLMIIEPKLFFNLQRLYLIDLSNNLITNLDKNLFQNLSSMWQINLQNNYLITIDFNAFQGCNGIKFVCLRSGTFFLNFTLNVTGLKNLRVFDSLNQNCGYNPS